MDVPYGYCHCGCGEKTSIARRSNSKQQSVKGQPNRFVVGHGIRVGSINHRWKGGSYKSDMGYILKLSPGNPRSNKKGYVHEAILVIEKAMGHGMRHGAIPHHVNGIRDDNRNQNLVACHDRAYHNFIHRRARALESCGNANFVRCKFCKEWSDPRSMYIRPGNCFEGWHRECSNSFRRKQWREKHDK